MDSVYSKLSYNCLREWRDFITDEFRGYSRPADVQEQLTQIESEIASRKFSLVVKFEGKVVRELARWHTEQECLDRAHFPLGEFILGGQTYEHAVVRMP